MSFAVFVSYKARRALLASLVEKNAANWWTWLWRQNDNRVGHSTAKSGVRSLTARRPVVRCADAKSRRFASIETTRFPECVGAAMMLPIGNPFAASATTLKAHLVGAATWTVECAVGPFRSLTPASELTLRLPDWSAIIAGSMTWTPTVSQATFYGVA